MPSSGSEKTSLESLLAYLRRNRGFDLNGYKRPSLARRIDRRMQQVGVQSYDEYIDYLEVHPDEFSFLFNGILINVSAFLRDPAAWDYIASQVIPRILESKSQDEPVRVWCAGVAAGQEAYTSAMLLAEAVGEEDFVRRVKIYATDLDEDALSQARQASYGESEVDAIPRKLLEKYFEKSGTRYVFRREFRRAIIFGRHDLLQDAPISRIDLLICRNTLMYFNAEAQARVLAHFHYVLNDSGFLFLGKSEMLLTHADMFVPVDLTRRVFTKVGRGNGRFIAARSIPEASDEVTEPPTLVRLRDTALDAAPAAQIVLDPAGRVQVVNYKARELFGITAADRGRPIQDLEISYRPVELRSLLNRVLAGRQPVNVRDVERSVGSSHDDVQFFDVAVEPLNGGDQRLIGVSVTYTDVTKTRRLNEDLIRAKSELETAYEELQSTNEELETTNEELQSTNEELETTNEELQSTNEELETMNEELQSTNEELQATNEELRVLSQQVTESRGYLDSILASLHLGVVVVDREHRIRIWNSRAADLWGLRADEVEGRNFLGLDIGLPVERLKQPIQSVLSGETSESEVVLAAMNRRGARIACTVIAVPLILRQNIVGSILLMDDRPNAPDELSR